jgi:RNA polymerase sigma factor (sigma-70 family)
LGDTEVRTDAGTDVGALLRSAADGDAAAWDALVARFEPVMWATARAYGLCAADADDAVQAAWLRLVENLCAIRDPARVGGWLLTTTRREAALLARKGRAVRLTPEPPEPGEEPDAFAAVFDADRRRRLWAAVATLPEPCRTLLRLLATAPDAGNHRLAVRLGMPVGSVGPTRSRCLRHLRTLFAAEEAGHVG